MPLVFNRKIIPKMRDPDVKKVFRHALLRSAFSLGFRVFFFYDQKDPMPKPEREKDMRMKEQIYFCDLLCKYAQLPKAAGLDGSGSCRTFIALFCRRKKKLVAKNLPCRQKVLQTKKRILSKGKPPKVRGDSGTREEP